ncbi:MAG: alpha/beta fold hydrolase [Planctomycetes bacterium]|nr:alpha/beta fold hydrolase [Planctomycetota bacterium]
MTGRRFLLAVLLLAVAAALCVAVAPLRDAVFPWTVSRVLETTLLTWPPWGFRVTRVAHAAPVDVPVRPGRALKAELFRAAGPCRGRMLFVHGSIPKGRAFSPYRFLARELAGAGYDVLLPDIGGYGESRLKPDQVPEFGRDVAAAARFLTALDGAAAGDGLLVLAHSLGASMALRAVVHHGLRPARLVLWDPPISGELGDAETRAAPAVGRFRSELQVEGGGRLAVDDAVLVRYCAGLDPIDLLRALPAPPQIPTLVALGSLIGSHGPLVQALGLDTGWMTILDMTGVDHFLNMVSLGKEGDWLLYRPGNCGLLLDSLHQWLKRLDTAAASSPASPAPRG